MEKRHPLPIVMGYDGVSLIVNIFFDVEIVTLYKHADKIFSQIMRSMSWDEV